MTTSNMAAGTGVPLLEEGGPDKALEAENLTSVDESEQKRCLFGTDSP